MNTSISNPGTPTDSPTGRNLPPRSPSSSSRLRARIEAYAQSTGGWTGDSAPPSDEEDGGEIPMNSKAGAWEREVSLLVRRGL